jgi:hypothetical protein
MCYLDRQCSLEGIAHIQGGAEETHVFHIGMTLFIFNIKKFYLEKKKVF